MALTGNDVAFRVRGILNDSVTPFRYTNSDVLAYTNDAIIECYRHRPDFFIGSYGKSVTIVSLDDDLPTPDYVLSIMAMFVAGMCELRDDEHTNTGRANALITKFVTGLKTAAA